jgi:hypothetical protein
MRSATSNYTLFVNGMPPYIISSHFLDRPHAMGTKTDQECKPTLEAMEDVLDFQPNYATSQEHGPAAERATVSSRIVSGQHFTLLYMRPFRIS